MRYPKFLKKGDTIGLVAPSFGASIDPYFSRLQAAIIRFQNLGYVTKISPNAFSLYKCQSASKEARAQEIMDYYLDPQVHFLFSVAGGERMLEILPHLDFKLLKQAEPKFYQGYSDNTCLTFLLPTICDVASLYGAHAPDFGMQKLDISLEENLQIITGQQSIQHSYPFYEIESIKQNEGMALASYHAIHPVIYQHINCGKHVVLEGRILGGCLDVLVNLCGTSYDHVAKFNEKYAQEGVVWYLEAADLNPGGVLRALWQLRQSRWFEGAKGFLFGRAGNTAPFFDLTHDEAIFEAIGDLGLPIVTGVDIGHLPPTFTIINGANVIFKSQDNQGSIRFLLD